MRNKEGFTLVEMLLAMVVSFFVLAAIYAAYRTQQRTQTAQDQVAEMQQNIRAAMVMLSSDIRMAGFDPTGKANAGIVAAGPARLQFTQNLVYEDVSGNEDNDLDDPGENITYSIAKKYDDNQDGVVDTYPGDSPPALGRTSGVAGVPQPVSPNIEALEFVYLVGDDMQPTLNPDPAELPDIRAVTISLLMRTSFEDPDLQTGAQNFLPASRQLYNLNNGAWPLNNNDQFRRRLYFTTVQLRNADL